MWTDANWSRIKELEPLDIIEKLGLLKYKVPLDLI